MSAWRLLAVSSILGAAIVGSAVRGQNGDRPPANYPAAGDRYDPVEERWQNGPRPAAATAPSDELRRLQAELDALSRAQAEIASEPIPPGGETLTERAKLKEKVIELIERLKPSARATPPSQPTKPGEPPAETAKPVDRLRQAQNLYRAGDVKSAQRAIHLIEPSTLSPRHAALARYMNASCYRRLGDYEQAKKIYREIAASKDDEFLSECATWHLQAIQTREEMAPPPATTGTPSNPK